MSNSRSWPVTTLLFSTGLQCNWSMFRLWEGSFDWTDHFGGTAVCRPDPIRTTVCRTSRAFGLSENRPVGLRHGALLPGTVVADRTGPTVHGGGPDRPRTRPGSAAGRRGTDRALARTGGFRPDHPGVSVAPGHPDRGFGHTPGRPGAIWPRRPRRRLGQPGGGGDRVGWPHRQRRERQPGTPAARGHGGPGRGPCRRCRRTGRERVRGGGGGRPHRVGESAGERPAGVHTGAVRSA